MRRSLLASLLVCVLAAVPAAGTGLDLSATPTRASLRALRTVLKAGGYVAKHDPRCRPKWRRTSLMHGLPSQHLLATFGVLRRPAGPDDHLSHKALGELGGVGIYEESVRVAHAADGREFYVYAARDRGGPLPGRRACTRMQRRRLRHLLAGEPHRIVRLARLWMRGFAIGRSPSDPPRPWESVGLFERSSSPHSFSPVGDGVWAPISSIEQTGLWLSSVDHHRRAFVLLVPDGVASITAVFPRIGRKPPHGERKVYAAAVERTAAVQENIASFSSPRHGWDTYPTHLVWHAADGSVLRTTPPPPLWWFF